MSQASFANEPLGFKEFEIGGDLAAYAQSAGMRCMPPKEGVTTCATSTPNGSASTIAGVQVERIYFMGLQGRLGDITVRFSSARFAEVLDAYRARFARIKCKESVVQNRMGAKFDQTECEHESAAGLVRLTKRGSNLDTAEVSLTSTELIKFFSRGAEEDRQKAKKDI